MKGKGRAGLFRLFGVGFAVDRAMGCFAFVHRAGFAREILADVVAVRLDVFAQFLHRLDQLGVGRVGHGLRLVSFRVAFLRHGGGHEGFADGCIAAGRTSDMVRLVERVEGIGRLKPAFKAVLVFTFQRVADHDLPFLSWI